MQSEDKKGKQKVIETESPKENRKARVSESVSDKDLKGKGPELSEEEYKTSASESIFEKICRLARNEDSNGLARFLDINGIDINLLRENGYTPVMLLAKEGSMNAVNFLLNRFCVDDAFLLAMEGYAEGGFYKEVEAIGTLLQRVAANIDHVVEADVDAAWLAPKMRKTLEDELVNIKEVARWGDNVLELEPAAWMAALHLAIANVSFESVLRGYARAGDEQKIEKLLKDALEIFSKTARGIEDSINRIFKSPDIVQTIVRELRQYAEELLNNYQAAHHARAGEIEKVDGLLNDKADIGAVVEIYAELGNETQVDILLKREPEARDRAVRGYVRGGFVEAVDKLIKRDEKAPVVVSSYQIDVYLVPAALRCYTELGDIQRVNELLSHYSKDGLSLLGRKRERNYKAAIEGYAKAGMIEQAIDLFKRFSPSPQETISIADSILRLSHSSGYLANENALLRILSLIDDEETRKQIVSGALNYKKRIETSNSGSIDGLAFLCAIDYNSLLVKAAKMHDFMKKYDIDYDFAQNVKQALQIKNARTWLLQGWQVIEERENNTIGKIEEERTANAIATVESKKEDDEDKPILKMPVSVLPLEVYLHITTLTLGLSIKETEQMLRFVHRQLFADISQNLFSKMPKQETSKFKRGLQKFGLLKPPVSKEEYKKAMETFDKEQHEASERHELRSNMKIQ